MFDRCCRQKQNIILNHWYYLFSSEDIFDLTVKPSETYPNELMVNELIILILDLLVVSRMQFGG